MEDNLGLNQQLRLGRVSKIPKITDELIFDKNRGIPQIIAAYPKVAKALKRSDKKLASRLEKEAPHGTKKHAIIADHEHQNLGHVLEHYQLWCHGFFPRANFRDCIQLLRRYKSARLREYRRELIASEIRRLKIEKGIISEEPEEAPPDIDDDLYEPPLNQPRDDPEHDSEDDWGFLLRRRPNNLFVGDDDDDEPTVAAPVPRQTLAGPEPEDEYPDLDDFDEHEAELAAMQEMGL